MLWVPQANCFSADDDASFSQGTFNIPVAPTEAIIEPDGVRNDIWGKSVAFVGVHRLILQIMAT